MQNASQSTTIDNNHAPHGVMVGIVVFLLAILTIIATVVNQVFGISDRFILSTIPVPDTAINEGYGAINFVGGWIRTYQTPAPQAEIVMFHSKSLAANGWRTSIIEKVPYTCILASRLNQVVAIRIAALGTQNRITETTIALDSALIGCQ